MKHNLSIIIPVYKEENRIERCIEESVFFFKNNNRINKFEIIFVADISGDGTINIIRYYKKKYDEIQLIVNKTRLEKGFSVKKGMLRSKYDLLLFYDTDLSTPLYETNKFLDLVSTYDILIGSRGLKESKVEKRIFKIILSRGFSLLKKILLDIDFKDTQCGFKMFKNKCKFIFQKQTIKSSAFDVEILYIAKKNNLQIKEIPITWIDSDTSNFNWSKVIMRFFIETLKIKINDLKGLY